jgi:hypothetical protein
VKRCANLAQRSVFGVLVDPFAVAIVVPCLLLDMFGCFPTGELFFRTL